MRTETNIKCTTYTLAILLHIYSSLINNEMFYISFRIFEVCKTIVDAAYQWTIDNM